VVPSSKSSETVFILARARGMPQIDVPDHKHPKFPCCPAGLGAQAELLPQ
jgi:hypothetical protein